MTKKSQKVILDTVIIIQAHENNCWEALCAKYDIGIPAIILEDEAFHFTKNGEKHGMNPTSWLAENKVHRLEATMEDFLNLEKKLHPDIIASLDPGELEVLALIDSKDYEDYFFSTADSLAIRAMGILGLGHRGISMEHLLIKIGLKKNIPQHYTKEFFKKYQIQGFTEQHLWLKK